MTRLFAIATAVAIAGTAVAADETYTIKLYKPKVGDSIKSTRRGSTEGKVEFSIMGQKGEQPIETSEVIEYTDEIVEMPKEGRRPTKQKRSYDKIDRKGGPAGNKKSALAGSTVTIERDGEKFKYSIDGKDVTKEQQAELDADFVNKKNEEKQDLLLPGKAVKVGDTWTIDGKKAIEAMGEQKQMEVDAVKSKFTCTLKKVESKDGKPFGTLEFQLELAVKKVALGPGQMVDADAGSTVTATQTVVTCIDGSLPGAQITGEGKIEISAALPMNGSMKISAKSKEKNVEEAVKK